MNILILLASCGYCINRYIGICMAGKKHTRPTAELRARELGACVVFADFTADSYSRFFAGKFAGKIQFTGGPLNQQRGELLIGHITIIK